MSVALLKKFSFKLWFYYSNVAQREVLLYVIIKLINVQSIDNVCAHMEKGAEMCRITNSVEEILYAVFNYASKCFKKLGD